MERAQVEQIVLEWIRKNRPSVHLPARTPDGRETRGWTELDRIVKIQEELDRIRVVFDHSLVIVRGDAKPDPDARSTHRKTLLLDREGNILPDDEISDAIRKWLAESYPPEESLGRAGSCGAFHTWTELDDVLGVRKSGEELEIEFLFSKHRESEFTVYVDGDESLVWTRRMALRLGPDGKVIEAEERPLKDSP